MIDEPRLYKALLAIMEHSENKGMCVRARKLARWIDVDPHTAKEILGYIRKIGGVESYSKPGRLGTNYKIIPDRVAEMLKKYKSK